MSDKPNETTQPEPTPPETGGSDALSEFFANYSGGGYRFMIHRRTPKTWPVAGVLREIEGHIETTEEVPTPDYIKANWGGGTYLVQIQAPTTEGKGGYRFVTARTIKISGDPRLRSTDYDTSAHQPATPTPDPNRPTLADRMFEQAALRSERAEERLERERHERLEAERERARMAALVVSAQERKPSVDPTVWQHAVSAIQTSAENQVETLRQQLTRRDAELAELRRDLTSNKGMDPQIVSAIQTSAESQVETLRQQLTRRDAEMAELRREIASNKGMDPQLMQLLLGRSKDDELRTTEAHRRELDALRREHEQANAMIERLHRSEVENLRGSHDRETRMLQMAHESATTAKDREIARLEAELAAARQAAGPTDPMQKIAELAELDELLAKRYGRAPETEPGWFQQAAHFVSELTEAAARSRMQSSPASQPTPPSVQPAIAQPQITMPAPAQPIPPPRQPDGGGFDLMSMGAIAENALGFVEAALRAGTPAEQVARSAMSMFPAPAVKELAKTDPAVLIRQLEAALGPDHVMVSPAGRDFVRKLLPALGKEVERA